MHVGLILRSLAVVAATAGPVMTGPALADTAIADPVQNEVTAALVDQGYDILSVNRTWLGRVRIVAQSDELRREVVFNPTTGEVLRDYSMRLVAAFPDLGFEDDNPAGSDRSAATRQADTSAAVLSSDPAASTLEVVRDSVATTVDRAGQ